MITIEFAHIEYGPCKAVAELWFVTPKQFKTKKPNVVIFNNDDLICVHCIREVQPPLSPLQLLVGCFFTDFNTSAALLGAPVGWNNWKILNYPALTMQDMLDGAYFVNHDSLEQPVPYAGSDISELYPLQLMTLASVFDCSTVWCSQVDESTEECLHGVVSLEDHSLRVMQENSEHDNHTKQGLRGLEIKIGAIEMQDVLRCRPWFMYDLHLRLNKLRVANEWESKVSFVTGPGLYQFRSPYLIKSINDMDTWSHYFTMEYVLGLSVQDVFINQTTVDESQRIFLSVWTLKDEFRDHCKQF